MLLNLVLGVYRGGVGGLWTFERTFDTLQGDFGCVSPALKKGVGTQGQLKNHRTTQKSKTIFFSCSPGFCFELLFVQ